MHACLVHINLTGLGRKSGELSFHLEFEGVNEYIHVHKTTITMEHYATRWGGYFKIHRGI